jgi:hypothetical protein
MDVTSLSSRTAGKRSLDMKKGLREHFRSPSLSITSHSRQLFPSKTELTLMKEIGIVEIEQKSTLTVK